MFEVIQKIWIYFFTAIFEKMPKDNLEQLTIYLIVIALILKSIFKVIKKFLKNI